MNSQLKVSVDIQFACDETGIPSAEEIQGWVELAVGGAQQSYEGDVELAVRVVDADEMRTLNSTYRQQDKATNVLSFPASGVDGLPDLEARILGDVVICASVVGSEAADQGKSLADHWGHMLLHGTLHLLGHDHNTDAEAVEMEALEAHLLAARGITDPYAAT